MNYNVNQISKGVSPQRVEEFKQKTAQAEGKLLLKKIVYVVFGISLGIIWLICK